ncbi:MAG: hypothetical protein IKB38_06845 [Clostridia bacterium]|nr:hypothetical protein [Clostridia bacterium]
MTKDEFAKYVASRIKSVRNNPLTCRRLNNYDDILLACEDVYSSGIIFPRFGRLAKRKGLDVSVPLADLAKRLFDYFRTTVKSPYNEVKFDEFHEKACDTFLQLINSSRSKKGYDPLNYGSAQKMINMVFKYLACYSDYTTYEDCFEHCHMPIDSKILCELKKTYSIPNVNYCFYAKICGGATFEGKSWTKFDKTTYGDLLKITRTTIAKDSKYTGKTLLEIEFEIWK